MQDLLLLLGTTMFLAAGFVVPFVMSLGYVWVDVFTPQDVSGSLLAGQPLAFIFGACAFAVYFTLDRRERPSLSPVTILQLLILVWITVTLSWAVAPATAYWRWDIASKMCLFAAFLPYVIRSRVQIEACVLVYVFAICGHMLPWGFKTFITGGGYNQSLGLLRVNSNLLAESSSVSGIAVMIVPLLLVMRKHSVLLPRHWVTTAGVFGVIMVSLVGAIGTFARTALIAFAVGGTAMWLRSKRKVLFLFLSLIVAAVLFSVTSDRWTQRISTISEYDSEGSALVRLLVWQWAWDFAQSHPWGGGFWANVTSRIEIPSATGEPIVQFGRAYHNIYFGVLADQGYLGLGLYMTMIGMVMLGLQKTRKLLRGLPQHDWCAELAQALQVSILTMLAVGMFVEIGWTPIVWYLFSMAVSVRAYAQRVVAPVVPRLSRPRTALAKAGEEAFERDAAALSGPAR